MLIILKSIWHWLSLWWKRQRQNVSKNKPMLYLQRQQWFKHESKNKLAKPRRHPSQVSFGSKEFGPKPTPVTNYFTKPPPPCLTSCQMLIFHPVPPVQWHGENLWCWFLHLSWRLTGLYCYSQRRALVSISFPLENNMYCTSLSLLCGSTKWHQCIQIYEVMIACSSSGKVNIIKINKTF